MQNTSNSNAFLVFLLILGGGSLLKQSNTASLVLLTITALYTVGLFLIHKYKIYKNDFNLSLRVILFFSLIFLIQMLFLNNNLLSNQYLTFSFQIFTVLLVLTYFNSSQMDFTIYMYRVLKYIMYYSLVSFFAWYIVKGHLSTIMIGEYPYDTFYYILYYQHIGSALAEKWRIVHILNVPLFIRNQGLFWEPGVHQIFMNLLLFLALFRYKQRKIVLLASFIILTTWSTTGLFIMFFQYIVYFIHNMKKQKFLKFLPIFVLGMTIFGFLLIQNYSEKVEGFQKTSALQRKLDTYTSLKIIENNLIFGIGLDSRNYFKQLNDYSYEVARELGIMNKSSGITNSIVFFFVFFGVPLGILFLFSLYKQQIIVQYNYMFFVIIMTSATSEPVLLLTFFTLFLVSGLKHLFSFFK